jgi:hypothetical protein
MKKFKTKKELKIFLLEQIKEMNITEKFYLQSNDHLEAGKCNGITVASQQVIDLFLYDVDINDHINREQFVCMDLYKRFAEYLGKTKPIIKDYDCVALRKIIAYLRTINQSDDIVMANFEIILRSWGRLPKNYSTFITLAQINNNLFGIISHIKLKQFDNDKFSNERRKQESEFSEIGKDYRPSNSE